MLKERNRKLYFITIIMFAVYLLLLVWIVLFKLEFSLAELDRTREYNFIPFHYGDGHNVSFHFSEVINNMLIFIPVGIYLCSIFRKIPFMGKAALVFTLSLALECSQFIFAIGRFDITDLITNTVGGVLGIGVYLTGRTFFCDKVKAEQIIAFLVDVVTVLLVGGTILIVSLN